MQKPLLFIRCMIIIIKLASISYYVLMAIFWVNLGQQLRSPSQ